MTKILVGVFSLIFATQAISSDVKDYIQQKNYELPKYMFGLASEPLSPDEVASANTNVNRREVSENAKISKIQSKLSKKEQLIQQRDELLHEGKIAEAFQAGLIDKDTAYLYLQQKRDSEERERADRLERQQSSSNYKNTYNNYQQGEDQLQAQHEQLRAQQQQLRVQQQQLKAQQDAADQQRSNSFEQQNQFQSQQNFNYQQNLMRRMGH